MTVCFAIGFSLNSKHRVFDLKRENALIEFGFLASITRVVRLTYFPIRLFSLVWHCYFVFH